MSVLTVSCGPGLAPDVTIRNGQVYLAYGTTADLQLVVFDAHGTLLARHSLPGFFNSFPRFSGDWLVYKAADFTPAALHLHTGEARHFTGRVDGNWGIVGTEDFVVWQSEPGYTLTLGHLADTAQHQLAALFGAPDGLEAFTLPDRVLHRKDIRLVDPAVGGYAQRAGDLMVGQYGFGTGVRFDGDATRWLHGGTETMDPRCATDGQLYAIASWGNAGVRLTMGTRADYRLLPLVPADRPDPPPPPVNPPPIDPPPPMSTPNRFDVVHAQWALQPALPHSTESCGEFTRRVAWALNPTGDPNGWGLLSKTPGEGQHRGFAVDAIIYAPTQQVIDIIGGAEGPNPQPGWQEVPKRDSNHWTAPIQPDGGTPPPPPPPVDTALLQRVAALEARLTALVEVDGWHDEHIDVLRRRVKALEDAPAPVLELPADVVRESTHQVRTALRLSGVLTGTIVRK